MSSSSTFATLGFGILLYWFRNMINKLWTYHYAYGICLVGHTMIYKYYVRSRIDKIIDEYNLE